VVCFKDSHRISCDRRTNAEPVFADCRERRVYIDSCHITARFHQLNLTMVKGFIAPVSATTDIFKDDIFKGKVLFCTGGGSGICKQMTESIMRHGADAAIVGRKLDRLQQSADELSKATGKTCIAAQADVRQPEQLKAAVAKTIEKFGRIDFVICGAAGNFLAPISGLSENAFRTVIEIDTLGTFNTVKATISHLRKSKGAYIHVSATLHYRGVPMQAHVSSAKAGVNALSQVLAIEEGPWGVRSNVIAPGPISGTEGMDRLGAKRPDGSHDEERYESHIPLGRQGHKVDCASAAVYLFSGAASWVTGVVLEVDGGTQHFNMISFPYPASVLDSESIKSMIKPRL